MAKEFKLPDVGEGVAEGEIGKWLVKEGDTIKENQPLVEVLTDKVNVEIPSPYSGKVLRLLAREGEVVKVGQVIVIIGESGETVAPGTEAKEAAKPTTDVVTQTQPEKVPMEEFKVQKTILVAPATRKLAAELDVDLALVEGSGPGGRITEIDVRRHAESRQEASSKEVIERVALKGVRRQIAQKMKKSAQEIPHVSLIEEVDMTEIVLLREKLKAEAESQGIRLTYLPFLVKALVRTLKEFPYFNASVDQERNEIVLKRYYNIGIATATENGLVVPVVKDADKKGLFEIASEVEVLSRRAREGRMELTDVHGGTFTITSVGSIGGLITTPIINYPEVAVLAVNRIVKRPIFYENKVEARDMMYLTITFDHRILDGASAAEFMNSLKHYLENPRLVER